jgi:SAM-dependent methyltransferase
MKFKVHFSSRAGDYAEFRPVYPQALFEFLANTAKSHNLAWDCATGSGQAARGLVEYFDRVIATDMSAEQLRHAEPHPQITYRVAAAENSNIPSRSVDLITVAQALHWLSFESFFQEVCRVLKSGGLIAVWCYGPMQVNAAVDLIVRHYYKNIVGSFWPPERRYIDEKYQTVPFPFVELPAPEFIMRAEWNLNEFIGYLRTWSAAQRYQDKNAQDPLDLIRGKLAKAWSPAEQRLTIQWPVYLRLGTVTPLPGKQARKINA